MAVQFLAQIHNCRINRNIVECKFVSPMFFASFHANELIETLWNVNRVCCTPVEIYLRINRNIVECKSVCFIALLIAYIRINRNIVECK